MPIFTRTENRNTLTMKWRRWWISVTLILGIQLSLSGQNGNNMTREAYVSAFSELAMKEMARVVRLVDALAEA